MHQNSNKTNAVEFILPQEGGNGNLKTGGNSLNM
jgi:hypothetical protein